MKLIIAGSTHIHSREELITALRKSKFIDEGIEEVIVGHEPGMTQAGRLWAIDNNITVRRFRVHADSRRSRSAAMVNRGQMLSYADALLFITDSLETQVHQILHMAKGTKNVKVYVHKVKEKKEKS